MKYLSPLLAAVAARWNLMTPTAKTFAIALPVSFLVMEFPAATGWLPPDLKKDVADVAYYTWKGAIAFVSWHIIGPKNSTTPTPAPPTK